MVAQARFEAMVPLRWGARHLLPTTAGGPLGQERLEHAPQDPDHTAVLADLDPELHRLPLGIPAFGRRGWGTMSFALSSSMAR